MVTKAKESCDGASGIYDAAQLISAAMNGQMDR